ncbi:ABC transporter ATP-binding protein [Mucilaginibacter ginsenosidivorax]|uniref:ABC transporter ATP-binding protein n=1 Tax=Mucilaginibacter ginsenosidivorax TaxID=862126 RepID=A0A5B8W1H0_9SPHI|nr:ABC transporter ATP-binding protein [Mucilaginibacter ginsenosidivorax]QEC76686.1 ABC transporter ATP-binding protein [Mucilaginibacter ginsenosidivorax]
MDTPVLQAININKYFLDPVRFRVLTDINFSINRGSFVSITGKSGCGKSTLLYVLSTMDTDYEGELLLDNETLGKKNNAELAIVRNQKIGFVFQFHYLIQEFNVLKNVMLPAMKLGKYANEVIEEKAMQHLKTLGIYDQALKNASQLSGGQKQRVAIARALINDPLIIMGDEPTGNLDKKNSDVVFEILKDICLQNKQTILVVTHDPDFAKRADRTIRMEDGKIISEL